MLLTVSACTPIMDREGLGDIKSQDTRRAEASEIITVINDERELLALRRQSDDPGSIISPDAVGYYLDVQTARLQAIAQEGVAVEKRADHIAIVLSGQESFAVGSSSLKPEMRRHLDKLAVVMNEYEKNLIFIGGHSDSSGDPAYNIALSQGRASAVGQHLVSSHVASGRLVVMGFGDAEPLGDNSSELGRAKNRRIEIELWPLIGGE